MPHRYYHGRTGLVWNVTPRAVGVLINKRVKSRIMQKKIHVRIEHVKPSKCKDLHKLRVKHNASLTQKKKEDKPAAQGQPAQGQKPAVVAAPVHHTLKRVPALPDKAHFVAVPDTGIETFTPQRYLLLL